MAQSSDLFKNKLYHNGLSPSSLHVSLTTHAFRWLLPEAWDDDSLQFYVRMRNSLTGNFFRLPSAAGRKKKPAPTLTAAWILKNAEDQAEAIAELHSYTNYIETQFLFVCPVDPEPAPDFANKVSFLISSIFINSKADIIYLASQQAGMMTHFESLEWGIAKSIHAPSLWQGAHPSPSDLLELRVLCLWKEKWWEGQAGQSDRKQLQYLLLRLQKQEKAANERSCEARRKKPFSFLRRLFRPRIDD